MGWLLILFTVVPLLELTVLVQVGAQIGAGRTILVCLLTGVVGASLARSQGMGVLRRISSVASRGQLPAKELVDALLILVAGIVLLTPGFVTDAMGLLLLLPPSRAVIRGVLFLALQRKIAAGAFQAGGNWSRGSHEDKADQASSDIYPPGSAPGPAEVVPPAVIDLTPRREP